MSSHSAEPERETSEPSLPIPIERPRRRLPAPTAHRPTREVSPAPDWHLACVESEVVRRSRADMRIGVIGGGITGLACAHYLLRRGVRPIVFESSERLRPWGTRGKGDHGLDPFPISLRRSDTAICGLIADLGLTSRLQWQHTPCGVHAEGRLHPLGNWLDLLRFSPLAHSARLRAAFATYGSLLLRTYARPLDSIRTREWFRRTCGLSTYETLWRRVLAARFGSAHVDELPAYLAWQSLREELLGMHQTTGTLRGGFGVLCDALANSITEAGGEIRVGTPVQRVEADEGRVWVDVGHGRVELDAAIAAIPLAKLGTLVKGELLEPLRKPMQATRPQEITSLRVRLRGPSPLGKYFRIMMLDEQTRFPVAIDASRLLPDTERNGHSLLYLVRLSAPERSESAASCSRSSEQEALRTLRQLDPELCASRLAEVHTFRWESPEPVWPVDALRQPIPERLGKFPLHVCTAAQAYPRSATPETAVMLARDCIGRLLRATP